MTEPAEKLKSPVPKEPGTDKKCTYADYLTWDDGQRRELVGGVVSMSPAPLRKHQRMSVELSRQIANQLEGRTCEAYTAPFDVRLPESPDKIKDEEIYTTVQPDISVICDTSKLDERGCLGAPDLIIEIVSGTSKRDLQEKFKLYEKHGVKEYWIVHPEVVQVFILGDDSKYFLYETFSELLKSQAVENLEVDLLKVFT